MGSGRSSESGRGSADGAFSDSRKSGVDSRACLARRPFSASAAIGIGLGQLQLRDHRPFRWVLLADGDAFIGGRQPRQRIRFRLVVDVIELGWQRR